MKKFLRFLAAASLACLAFLISACMPWNLDKAQEKMEKAGYEVTVSREDAEKADDCEGCIIAIKSGDGLLGIFDTDMLIAFYFDDKDDATEFVSEASALYEAIYGTVKQDGKWVYAGTAAAIEAFEK